MKAEFLVSIEDLICMGVDEEAASCWFLSRGKNKLTTMALKRVISEAEKLGWSLAKAVEYSAEHGYIGFKADWVKPENVRKTHEVGFIELHTDKSWANGLGNQKTNVVDFVELHTNKNWRNGL